jgi:predicted restriction endonuclease
LSIPELLNASHIVPWSIDPANRVNPKNGLCLNALHDRAFDRGLLTITPEMRVKVSPVLKSNVEDNLAPTFFLNYDDKPITLPERFAPDPDFLKFHNETIFQG